MYNETVLPTPNDYLNAASDDSNVAQFGSSSEDSSVGSDDEDLSDVISVGSNVAQFGSDNERLLEELNDCLGNNVHISVELVEGQIVCDAVGWIPGNKVIYDLDGNVIDTTPDGDAIGPIQRRLLQRRSSSNTERVKE
jgi:hypothetical protein